METDNFQVDLRSLIDLLARHLYSTPNVFVRELLQNAVDAITARRKLEPKFEGQIQIELVSGKRPVLIIQDNGIGLTAEQAKTFLATIGKSSKKGDAAREEGFVGQFGVGLLSAFLVSSEITVITRALNSNPHDGIEWKGASSGTYSVRQLNTETAVGTKVFIQCNEESLDIFKSDFLIEQCRYYGAFLPFEITFREGESVWEINSTPPWKLLKPRSFERSKALEVGESLFDRKFIDAFPLVSKKTKAEGIAYVLSTPTHAGSKQSHRIYLKNMLVTTKPDSILPDWACFIQCVINSQNLTPTASRESFQEDQAVVDFKEDMESCLSEYLLALGKSDPDRLKAIIDIHELAIKSLAIENDEILSLFWRWFTFETTQGRMRLGDFLDRNQSIYYIPRLEQYRQITQIAAAEDLAVVNGGYVYDSQLLQRIDMLTPDIDINVFEVEDLANRLTSLNPQETETTAGFVEYATSCLTDYHCFVEVSKFKPIELPALYVSSRESGFCREIETIKEEADELWSGILTNVTSEHESQRNATLYFNLNNPLVRKIILTEDFAVQRQAIEMLYVQSLLMGHYTLTRSEMKLLNLGLLGLIDLAIGNNSRQEKGNN